jgi:hypothetical protein
MSSAATTATSRLMPVWGKSALVVGLFFFACWGAAIVYWRTTDRMPSAGELAFCLVGVPLLLSGGVWVSRRVIGQQATPVSATSAPSKRGKANPSQANTLAILEGSLRLSCGSSAEEVLGAMRTNRARPDLDRQLLDDDGFPLMSSRCSAADDEEVHEEISTWMSGNGFAGVQLLEEQLRALALATQVVEDLAANDRIPRQALRLLPVPPEEWSVELRKAAGLWLAHSIIQFGWQPDQIIFEADVHDGSDLTSVLRRLRNEDASTALAMIVAFASNLGDKTVSTWSGNQTLFTSSRPNGQIPGEGAAAMFVVQREVAASQKTTAMAMLCSLEEHRRDFAASQKRRSDPALLADLANRALDRAGIVPADIAIIASDTGHRSNCVLELMGLVSSVFPEQDNAEDVIQTGTATASCGAVPSLAALVLACHSTTERQRPALWVSNHDQYLRAVAVIRPQGVSPPEV